LLTPLPSSSGCGCIKAETNVRCEEAERYLGNDCPRYSGLSLRIPGYCETHQAANFNEAFDRMLLGEAKTVKCNDKDEKGGEYAPMDESL
jgi:hypothetical protein